MSNRRKRRKFRREHDYEGRVRNVRMIVKGKTKREATAKLRRAFAAAGHPTRPTGLEDFLTVHLADPQPTE